MASVTNVAVSTLEGISRASADPWPAQNEEKSLLPRFSAAARRAVDAPIGPGNAGAASAIGPISRIRRLANALAGRPVNTFVSTLAPADPRSASRCEGV